MSMDYNWEPKGAPQDSNWLDDDLGDVMSLLDKDYAPARNMSGMDMHIGSDDGADELDYIKFMLDSNSSRNQAPHQDAPQRSNPVRPMAPTGDDLDDIMGLLDLDYSKPQPHRAPKKAAPKAEPAYQAIPRTEAADDLDDIFGILDRDYTKPEPAKAAPAPHNGGLDDMDFIPGFDDFPDVDWDQPAPARAPGKKAPKKAKADQKAPASRANANPYPLKHDPPTAVRQGKDKLLPVLLGTAAAQVVAIAVIWVLWLL